MYLRCFNSIFVFSLFFRSYDDNRVETGGGCIGWMGDGLVGGRRERRRRVGVRGGVLDSRVDDG